jgi:ankyrin repeat protein
MPPIAQSFFGMTSTAPPPTAETQETEPTMVEKPALMEASEEAEFTPKTKECDFDQDPTELYLLLQKKDWDASIARAVSTSIEARTWVSRKEPDGKMRWRLLPLHAAIIFKAPENVIEALLGAYPRGAEMKDDQGMLPLHLAFRNGSTEGVVNLLLVAHPQSIDVKDRKGRIPLVLAQASTSPNRDAFMRALERGPTYYAVAAAATERAAVTAELRAIFDAKLIEIKKQHEQEMDEIQTDASNAKQDLADKVFELEAELNKTLETSQVLVDHVNSLEAQLTSRGDTERFLATKIATLDSSLKDISRAKEDTEGAYVAEKIVLEQANAELTTTLAERDATIATLTVQFDAATTQATELHSNLSVTKDKSVEEIQRLEIEWSEAMANGAVLEAQLKKKIETEHSLASQVSILASKLAESASEASSTTVSYAGRIQNLMNERIALRNTVSELTEKLSFVARELQKVSAEQDEIIEAAADHKNSMAAASQAHANIIANANLHENIVEKVNDERRMILEILVAQEKEILDTAEERQRLKESVTAQEDKVAAYATERENLVLRVNKQKEDIRRIVEEDLAIIPSAFSETMDADGLVDEVVKRTTESKEKEKQRLEEEMKELEAEAALKKVEIIVVEKTAEEEKKEEEPIAPTEEVV